MFEFFSLVRGQNNPKSTTINQNDEIENAGYNKNLTAKALARCSDSAARKLLSFEVAQKLKVLPLTTLNINDTEVFSAAYCAGEESQVAAAIRFSADMEVKLVLVQEEILKQAMFIAYKGDEHFLSSKMKQVNQNSIMAANVEIVKDSILDFRAAQSDPAQLLTALVDYAIARSASDLHILCKQDGCFVNLRIDGELFAHQEPICSLQIHQQMISRIKVLSGMTTTQKNLPQDGSFSLNFADRNVNIRVAVMPTVYGEKLVMRFMGCESLLPLDDLGLDTFTINAIEKITKQGEGAIIFCGPTGSGKSTTMYSLMNQLKNRNLSLVSIEDPVEMRMQGISQTEIKAEQGLDFLTCLRAVLRQDPDVLLLGEMRDIESAKIAMHAALTGHLLLSTVHSRNAMGVFMRLLGLGVDIQTMSASLRIVVCQHLLPKLCAKCRIFDLVAYREIEQENKAAEIFKPVGCRECDYTGFSGRILVNESILVDREISDYLSEINFNAKGLRKLLNQNNYVSLSDNLKQLLFSGQISYDQYQSFE